MSPAPPTPALRELRLGNVVLDFPVVQAALSGYSDAPMRIIARRLGADLDSSGAVTIGLSYWLERYDFPAAGGVARSEQLAGLLLRASWSP